MFQFRRDRVAVPRGMDQSYLRDVCMKSKKALKRLSEAEQIVSSVRDKYTGRAAIANALELANQSLAKARDLLQTHDGAASQQARAGREASTPSGDNQRKRARGESAVDHNNRRRRRTA